jgi:hypothetical protein
MSDKIQIKIVGGEEAGQSVERDLVASLLVGRSHKADVRLREADVSGRHFEFVRGETGCCVRVLSRNGLTVDGCAVGEGEVVPVRVGSRIEAGSEAKLEVVALPDAAAADAVGSAPSEEPAGAPSAAAGEDFFASESETGDPPSVVIRTAPASAPAASPSEATTFDGQAETRGDFEDALTDAGEGETQEMKTRVGSMEEIRARKRQLDRASAVRRWRFGAGVASVLLVLLGIWLVTGSRRHVSDAEGPFRSDGEPDVAEWEVVNEDGELEMVLEYPRDDRMKVTVSSDSNAVDVVSFLGIDRDVPFHLQFLRWRDPADLQNSLEDSFARRVRNDSEAGLSFESWEGGRPQGEFFDSVFPGYCEAKSQRGVRFMRATFTRAVKGELWHGVSLYLRHGDWIYQLRTEIPDIYWRRGGYRLTGEPHLAIFKIFSDGHWDSPGRGGLVSEKFSDDFLLQSVKRELSSERSSAWPTVESQIDTLLVRTWGEKPVMQKMAQSYYRSFLDQLTRFYNERRLAFKTARANGDEKRMRSVFTDVKAVFGPMLRDRRSSLVNDPEVWSCRQGR